MNPRDLLALADTLAEETHEAAWRSAVSRAYYAVFHVARHLLRQCRFEVPQAEQAHSYLWLRLANAGHPDVRVAGQRLSNLRRMRNWADYDLDQAFDQTVAIHQVQTALEIVQLLDEVTGEPAVRAQVTEAMKIYERDVLRHVTWHP